MLKIWGHRQAPNVAKVLWTCAELGLAYDLIETGGPHRGLDAPAYRAINPNGRVPTIDDAGFILWESHAIMRYLARREGDRGLYPDLPRAAAIVDQWLDWQGAHLASAVRDLVRLTIKADTPADGAVLARAEGEADTLFAIAETGLRNHDYLGGETFSIADIAVGIAYRRWSTLPIARAPLEGLDRWYAAVSARAAFAGF